MSVSADQNSVSHYYFYDGMDGSESDLSLSSHSGHFTLPWLTKEAGSTDDNDSTHNTDDGKPKVLIVGAGIGGLTLGILLLKAGVPFEIYERTKEVKPLGKTTVTNTVTFDSHSMYDHLLILTVELKGSGMSIGCTFGGLFEQLGILEEFKALGKPMIGADVFSEDGKQLFHVDGSERARL